MTPRFNKNLNLCLPPIYFVQKKLTYFWLGNVVRHVTSSIWNGNFEKMVGECL